MTHMHSGGRPRLGRVVTWPEALAAPPPVAVKDSSSQVTALFSRTGPLKLPGSRSRAAHQQAAVKPELRAEGRSSSDGAETPSGSDQLPQGHGLCTRPGLQPKLADKTR
ncbi:hypothetical protein AOLI_G00117870 [Acnodon oligacanthus]